MLELSLCNTVRLRVTVRVQFFCNACEIQNTLAVYVGKRNLFSMYFFHCR